MAEKENRCWPGYEPVKGKEPHEQGSCRPKAESKSTPAEKKFRGARRQQLDTWEAEHTDTRKSAAQHLHAPGTKPKKAAAKKKTTTKAPATKKSGAKSAPAKRKTATTKKSATGTKARE